ncbi:MAG: type II toxin-antitoxin system RelE/ParE family toxin [Sphingobium sp.]
MRPAAKLAWFVAYRLTRKTEEDVIDLYLIGIAQFGETVAEKFQDGLRKAFEFLSDYPASARERHEINPPVRAHPYKSHIVIYIVDGDDVLILGIRHSREDWIAGDHING